MQNDVNGGGEGIGNGTSGTGSPLVSAVIPAFGRPRRTQRAIDSVVAQTYRPLELVLVDDASSPPLEPRSALPDSELDTFVIRHDENRGANVARNTGLEAASGAYIALLDSDDEWLPTKIERQVAEIEARPGREASYTGIRLVDAEGRLTSIRQAERDGDIFEAILRLEAVPNNSVVMVSREALETVGGPGPEVPGWQDWEWALRLARHVEFDAVREPLAVKHSGTERVGRAYGVKRDDAYPVLRARIRELARSPEEVELGLAYLDFRLGYTALVTGHHSEARRAFLTALRRCPLESRFWAYLLGAGPHYPWLQGAKRALVRMLSS